MSNQSEVAFNSEKPPAPCGVTAAMYKNVEEFDFQKLAPCLITVDGNVQPVQSDRADHPPSLAQLQKWVGVYIQLLQLRLDNQDDMVMVVDEDAKIKPGVETNTLASLLYEHSDICGPVLVCSTNWIE